MKHIIELEEDELQLLVTYFAIGKTAVCFGNPLDLIMAIDKAQTIHTTETCHKLTDKFIQLYEALEVKL